ncbi:MAG: riboflavin synthase [Acholeplasmatales bacterium]|nr:MAG: riboflavin synthase [Acholeplasmatales bacterium]
MFTGIIEEVGRVRALRKGPQSAVLTVEAHTVLEGTRIGDSIATNGVCLTVTALGRDYYQADIMNETLNRTHLKHVSMGERVNLERALTLNTRLGGHLLSGHIDGTALLKKKIKQDVAEVLTFATDPSLTRLMVEKGSIAIDGISLTLLAVTERTFSVSIIPHTGAETTLLEKPIGDSVNVECDLIGKYVDKLLSKQTTHSTLLDSLKKHGF